MDTTDLGHICLPDNVRLSVAGQLLQEVSFQHILEKVLDSVGTNQDIEKLKNHIT